MTVAARPDAPQVREPEDDDLRDEWPIREARQRARRRRLLYGGVAAGMLATVVAVALVVGPTSPTTPLNTPSPTPVDDLMPPAGAVPSSPETGELVAAVTKIDEGAWFLYADGRLISIDNTRLESGLGRAAPHTCSRRTAPLSVSQQRMFDVSSQPNDLPSGETPFSEPRVRAGGRLLVGRPGTEALSSYGLAGAAPAGDVELLQRFPQPGGDSMWDPGGAKCQLITYLRGLALSLPTNEWVIQAFTPYVPAKYAACFGRVTIHPDGYRSTGIPGPSPDWPTCGPCYRSCRRRYRRCSALER